MNVVYVLIQRNKNIVEEIKKCRRTRVSPEGPLWIEYQFIVHLLLEAVYTTEHEDIPRKLKSLHGYGSWFRVVTMKNKKSFFECLGHVS